MTLYGHVRDGFPRIGLKLPARNGKSLFIEFIVDTGFDGELALPGWIISDLAIIESSIRPIMLADGTLRQRPSHELMLEGDEEPRRTEVLEIDGNPLLGVVFLSDNLLQVEMTDSGEVTVESL